MDIIMKPENEGTVPIIIELKKTDSEDRLEYESEEAIRQIHDRRHYLDMHGKVILAGEDAEDDDRDDHQGLLIKVLLQFVWNEGILERDCLDPYRNRGAWL